MLNTVQYVGCHRDVCAGHVSSRLVLLVKIEFVLPLLDSICCATTREKGLATGNRLIACPNRVHNAGAPAACDEIKNGFVLGGG